jgi:hypothetical protein
MTIEAPSPRGHPDRSPLVTLLAVPALFVMAALSSLGVAAGTPAPAGADPLGTCSTSAGVIVVVDFSHWGGSIERGCDADPTTGYDALQAAGFSTSGDQHDGPEFICRIDNEPPPAEDPCVGTPPATAYWSYWHADAGQNTWSYSVVGAASYRPQPGSVDAWTFGSTDLGGSGGQPSFLPSAVRAVNPPVAATAPSPSTGTHVPKRQRAGRAGATAGRSQLPAAAPSTPATVPTSAGSSSAPSTTTTPSATTSTTSTTLTPSATGESGQAGSEESGGATTPKIVDATPASLAHPSAGSPTALIVGAVLVAALATVAAIVARRRRRAS